MVAQRQPVEVFAEVCCPFTHVGLRRLLARRHELGRSEPRLHVRAWPLELVNGSPLDPQHVAREVDDLRRQVAPDLFRGFDPRTFPHTSLPAFALAAAAYRHGLTTGEAVSVALRSAVFEEGRDVADPAVLADIARRFDVAPPGPDEQQAAQNDLDEGRRRGVIGSPHFFLESGGAFCPLLDISEVDGGLRITVDDDAVRAFFADALGT